MNGISSTLKDEIKKTKDQKQKEKFKFISAIIITNILVAILCLPSTPKKVPTKDLVTQKKLHLNYQLLTVPLTLFVSEADSALLETPITLVSKDKKIIVEKAYLHEKTTSAEKGEATYFKIEIKNSDIVRVSEFANEGMVAVPYVEMSKPKTHIKKGSKYEVSI